ncbi:MAG: M15 family metallopeptidase [Solirubrobacterales bacterium]|nr:M15 family metallopeptidase [Solirubrobacterales bacterium]
MNSGQPERSRRFRGPGTGAVLLVALALAGFSGSVPVGADPPATVERAGMPFRGAVLPIDGGLRRWIKGRSWHRGCPVPLKHLRLVTFRHHGFDRRIHSGRLVVNARYARGILRVMKVLYRRHFPIRRARLVDAYGADDHRSMNADNTSAFNCREIAGRPGVWSEHAHGRAIDLNPVENPWVESSGRVSPPAGRPFARRSRHRPGMVHRRDFVVRAFARAGWKWGGNWPWPRDYQHFSTTGH